MSSTGTYVLTQHGLKKVSDAVPAIARPVFFNKGGVPSYDPSARRMFNSKQEKRVWLKENGLREGGIINPDKPFGGKYQRKISWVDKQASLKRQEWIKSQGGTSGLLNRLQQKIGG